MCLRLLSCVYRLPKGVEHFVPSLASSFPLRLGRNKSGRRAEGGPWGDYPGLSIAVEECVQDGNNMLIPIAVGGALAGLVLIVLIAYLIGRKRSHAGYQTI